MHFVSTFPGTWRGKVPVAIKQLKNDRVDNMPGGFEQAKNEFFKEMKVFQMVNHPNLVQVNTFSSKQLVKHSLVLYIKVYFDVVICI